MGQKQVPKTIRISIIKLASLWPWWYGRPIIPSFSLGHQKPRMNYHFTADQGIIGTIASKTIAFLPFNLTWIRNKPWLEHQRDAARSPRSTQAKLSHVGMCTCAPKSTMHFLRVCTHVHSCIAYSWSEFILYALQSSTPILSLSSPTYSPVLQLPHAAKQSSEDLYTDHYVFNDVFCYGICQCEKRVKVGYDFMAFLRA